MKKQKNTLAKKRSTKKISKGFSKLQVLASGVVIILVIAAVSLFLLKATPLNQLNPFTEKIAITKPHPDMARARQLTIDPTQDTVMRITTREKVKISLVIPKGALAKKQTIEMIPYYYDKDATTPSAGVIISPASVSFSQPVTMLFDLSESPFRTDAPKNQKDKTLRYSGNSQVLTLDKEAKELMPILVARELETSTQLRARILGGGGYVFTTEKDRQFTWAKHAFAKEKVNTLSLLEATNTLLSNKQPLSNDMRKKAEGAVAKIVAKKTPPASELYAALVAKKLLQQSKVSFVSQAYAYETSEGYFIAVCKKDGLSVEEYVGFAKAAQLMGFDAIGEKCLIQAKNLVTQAAEKVLNNASSTLKEVITALQDVQFLGIDEESQIDESLMNKAREIVKQDAKKVADDPQSTDVQAALELQKLQAFGVEGPVTDTLEKRLTEKVENIEKDVEETPPPPDEPQMAPDDYGDGPTIDEEEILTNQAMSVVGIELLKLMGIEELDEASLKEKFSTMAEETKMLNEAVYAACLELNGDDCDSKHAQIARDIDKALDDSYAVAEDIGQTQSQEYDEPEYDDVQLYIEPTEDPADAQGSTIEENYDEGTDTVQYESAETTTESYDQGFTEDNSATENYETTESYSEPSNE